MALITWLRQTFAWGRRFLWPKNTKNDQKIANYLSRLDQDFFSGDLPSEDEPELFPLVLGNLLRTRGDIDRAVRLREKTLESPFADNNLKGRTLFELGRDYRKAGFLDRAMSTFRAAEKAGFPRRRLGEELMRLHASSGDFASAAVEALKLGNPLAEAYYLVAQAREQAASGNGPSAARHLQQALAVCQGSAEAWLSLVTISLLDEDTTQALDDTQKGLSKSSASGRLILLEGLYAFVRGSSGPNIRAEVLEAYSVGLAKILNKLLPDATLCYYAGLFLQHVGNALAAEQWYTKSLVLESEFWAARLAILAIAAEREKLPALLADQIAFFTKLGTEAKRFVCHSCDMHRDTIFSQCPRCHAWHSAAFRLRLT